MDEVIQRLMTDSESRINVLYKERDAEQEQFLSAAKGKLDGQAISRHFMLIDERWTKEIEKENYYRQILLQNYLKGKVSVASPTPALLQAVGTVIGKLSIMFPPREGAADDEAFLTARNLEHITVGEIRRAEEALAHARAGTGKQAEDWRKENSVQCAYCPPCGLMQNDIDGTCIECGADLHVMIAYPKELATPPADTRLERAVEMLRKIEKSSPWEMNSQALARTILDELEGK